MYFCKYAYNLLWRTQFTWVVDACFIASQIDVWTQAYNGSTSRRKYVLNLLNVLHKNVTEEYKTDQFLHVIYWFLIYKSNLGNFFRNEWIFFLLNFFFFCTIVPGQSSRIPSCTWLGLEGFFYYYFNLWREYSIYLWRLISWLPVCPSANFLRKPFSVIYSLITHSVLYLCRP